MRAPPVALTWAVWLGAVVGVTALFVAVGITPTRVAHEGMAGVAWQGPLWPLRSWDFGWYARIAEYGYPPQVEREHAFYPLWPTLLALLSPLGFSAAGAVIALPASLAAFAGVARLAPQGEARRAAVALAVLPFSFALVLLYPDGLALACAAWACVLARGGRVASASMLGVLAGFARPDGVLTAIPAGWLAWRAGGRAAGLAAAAGPVAGAVAAQAVLWRSSGDPLAFTHAQDSWGRGKPYDLISSLVDVAETGHVQTLAEVAVAALAIWLCVRLWHERMAAPWGWFAAAVLAVSLGSGSFQSIGRHALFAFPLVWMAARAAVGHERIAVAAGVACNVALLAALWVFAP